MGEPEDETSALPDQGSVPPLSRRRWRVFALVLALFGLALAYGWVARKDIADNFLASQFDGLGLPATYEIAEIGPSRQVLRNVVIGDPKRPDLTIERIEVPIRFRLGMPGMGRITMNRPRLYGSYRNGKLSFGSLDKVLFAKTKEPFRLPDLDIDLIDGRGRMDTDFGPVGLKLEGKGRLRGGFDGTLAAIAPQLRLARCGAADISLFGKISVKNEQPAFSGPLRMTSLVCPDQQLTLNQTAIQVDGKGTQALDGGEGRLGLTAGTLTLADGRVTKAQGTARLSYHQNGLTAKYDIEGLDLSTPQLGAQRLAISGTLRARESFARTEIDGEVDGAGLQMGDGLDSTLADLERSSAGTLAAPLLHQARQALLREGRGGKLNAVYLVRASGDGTSVVVPQARLSGASGDTLLSVSRFQMISGGSKPSQISGGFWVGGAGLPQLAGRMESGSDGGAVMQLSLAEYRAGDASIAVPRLAVRQTSNGALGFAGHAVLSGPLPGGATRNLQIPLEGSWSSPAGLTLWRSCVPVQFDSLALSNLTLDRRTLTICPPTGGAIVRADGKGTRIAGGAPSLHVAGHLGGSPIRVASGPIGFAVPGTVFAQKLDIALGSPTEPTRFRIENLNARIGNEIVGKFQGTEFGLYSVPLDVTEANGSWRYANEQLTLSDTAFRVSDRQKDARFQPLIARGASLTLKNSMIRANAVLREPQSDREVLRADIRHHLSSGKGDADLAFDGIVFDDKLQPDTLSRLALGIIANAKGTVHGQGRIDWTPDKVTSTGRFNTDSLDFAAAFGPVGGLSGTVEFTDLLGMVTAPDQRVKIASINPGIEVNDGALSFEMRPDSLLVVNGGSWPFLGGRLDLLPSKMTMGAAETRRYTLSITGLEAAQLLDRMELSNISATGKFDGVLPLVFDQNGGRIESGVLKSQPPGGNVSYVGALTYRDLTPMANYAFDALKSLDYQQMRIEMDGPLAGEMVTRVSFEGLRQGAHAKRNFLTNQVAKLPILFHVNLKAPFFQLVTSFRSMYDTSYLRDPRSLGLIGADGKPLRQSAQGDVIQPPVSEKTP